MVYYYYIQGKYNENKLASSVLMRFTVNVAVFGKLVLLLKEDYALINEFFNNGGKFRFKGTGNVAGSREFRRKVHVVLRVVQSKCGLLFLNE